MLGVLAEVHAAALATTAAVREAGNAVARSPEGGDGRTRADRAAATAFGDAGLDVDRAILSLEVDPERGGSASVAITYRVPVVSLPFLGDAPGPTISVSARHVSPIDPYSSR